LFGAIVPMLVAAMTIVILDLNHVGLFGIRDGANLVVRDEAGNEIFAPSFSIWTTIESVLADPAIISRAPSTPAQGE
jgi:hypothetical protein